MLRYWETEFPALRPSKSKSGQRVYTEREIGIVRRIKELLYEEGYTIAGAKKRLEAEIEDGKELPAAEMVEALGDDAAEDEVEADAETDPQDDETEAAEPAEAMEEGEDDGGDEAAQAASPEKAPPAPDAPGESPVDTELTQRVETLEQGVGAALVEVRELLGLLGDTNPSAD